MSQNSPVDIEILMEQIRTDTDRRKANTLSASFAALVPPYNPGALLRFGNTGNAGPFLGSGWSHPEANYRWTDGTKAEMNFSFSKAPGDLILTFTAHPFLIGEIESQEVSARWNGVLVGEWNVRESKSYHTIILSHLSSARNIGLLTFDLPQSCSPASKNVSSDSRTLGLAFEELVLRPARELGL